MDPNDMLDRLRTKLTQVEAVPYEKYGSLAEDIDDLADLVRDLDDWLSRGGYLPTAWSPTNSTRNVEGVGVEVVPDGDCYAVVIEGSPARSAGWTLREDAERLGATLRQIPVAAVNSGFDLRYFVGDLIHMLNTQNVLARLRSMS